jgi:hypothetical protein
MNLIPPEQRNKGVEKTSCNQRGSNEKGEE